MIDGEIFTDAETERQDIVDNLIYQLLTDLAPWGAEIDWDIEYISRIRDVVQEILVDELGLTTEIKFYPYRELNNE
jgi:hypothetical protein